jgi:hypothetical protein
MFATGAGRSESPDVSFLRCLGVPAIVKDAKLRTYHQVVNGQKLPVKRHPRNLSKADVGWPNSIVSASAMRSSPLSIRVGAVGRGPDAGCFLTVLAAGSTP